jgi:hypothetical protein
LRLGNPQSAVDISSGVFISPFFHPFDLLICTHAGAAEQLAA